MVNEFEILKDVTVKLSANNIAYMLSGNITDYLKRFEIGKQR